MSGRIMCVYARIYWGICVARSVRIEEATQNSKKSRMAGTRDLIFSCSANGHVGEV